MHLENLNIQKLTRAMSWSSSSTKKKNKYGKRRLSWLGSSSSSAKNRKDCDSNRERRRSSVSFAEEVDVYPTLPLNAYTEEERSLTWFTAKEFDEISRRCCKIIKKLHRGNFTTGRKYCVRGLEKMTPEQQDERYKLRQKVCLLVLEEQERQKDTSFSDPMVIAFLYRQAGAEYCQAEAQMIGTRDASFVRGYMKQKNTKQ